MVTSKTRKLVYFRDQDRCVVCGTDVSEKDRTIQHRIKRGNGGSKAPRISAPSNLLTCCWKCNTERIEQDIEDARRNGWALKHSQNPLKSPVRHAVYGWVLLDDAGLTHPSADLSPVETGDTGA